MSVLSQCEAFVILAVFGLCMIALVWSRMGKENESDAFLLANRKVSTLSGAFSIAVSWIWAPAIFICSMQAYTNGLPGIFWFTAPNILCFFLFTPVAIKLRRMMPMGFTLPEFIFKRFEGNRQVHIAYLLLFLGYQLGAIVINALAGGLLLHALCGIDVRVAIIAITTITLSYSLLGGLKASILTDFVQMGLILTLVLILVPWCVVQSDGFTAINSGLGGISGTHRDLFDPWIAFSMGIPMTLGLLAGPLSDQMFFQRAFACEEKNIKKIFILGGLLFALVPISLSLLGFIGVDLQVKGLLNISDAQMVGPMVISYLLPKIALYAFCVMALAGLCSTMDSALCAGSSLGGIDIYRRYLNPQARDEELTSFSRKTMILLACAGAAIALCQPKLLWVFLIYGAFASAGMFPTLFAIWNKKLSARAALLALMFSLIAGLPLSVYANVTENPFLIVVAALLSVGTGLLVCMTSLLHHILFDWILFHRESISR